MAKQVLNKTKPRSSCSFLCCFGSSQNDDVFMDSANKAVGSRKRNRWLWLRVKSKTVPVVDAALLEKPDSLNKISAKSKSSSAKLKLKPLADKLAAGKRLSPAGSPKTPNRVPGPAEETPKQQIEIFSMENLGQITKQTQIVDEVETQVDSQLPPLPPAKNSNSNAGEGSNSRKSSPVWVHFTKPVSHKDGTRTTSCIYCGNTFKCHSKGNGTSSLKAHSERCKKKPANEDKTQTKLSLKCDKGPKPWSFDPKLARETLAIMLIKDELAFRFVEGEGFRELVSVICPMFNVPSRASANRDVFKTYVAEKERLKKMLKVGSPRVSLTTDTWTSNQQINYMCLTAHFIDENWNLNKMILNFCPINSHRGEDIGKAVEKCLLEWELDRVLAITVDNASSNETAINYLKRKFGNKSCNVLGGRFMHMRCAAHVINLVVTDGLQMVSQSVERVRAAVRYVKHSPSRIEKFRTCVEAEKIASKSGLCLDVATRWNSTYLMLCSATKFDRAFERFAEVEPLYVAEMETKLKRGANEPLGLPTDFDWAKVKRLMKFLKHFYDLTQHVSGSHYVTSNCLLHEVSDTYHLLRNGLVCDDLELREISSKMMSKYNKYWGDADKLNLIIFLAPVLDPRHKLEFVLYVIDRMFDSDVASKLKENVISVLNEFFNDYKEKYGSATSCEASRASPTPTEMDASQTDDVFLIQKSVMAAEFKRRKINKDGSTRSELDRYLKEEFSEEEEENFKILEWWKINSNRFPILSKMARDILAVPITTVSSESAFSTGGRVLDDFRSSMTPRIVQALVCCQDWIKRNKGRDTLEEDEKELDELEEEFKKLAIEPSLML